MTITVHPAFGFARGAVVRPRGETGPNMLVVRGFGDRTAVVVIEGDNDGALRLRDLETVTLELVVPEATPLGEGPP